MNESSQQECDYVPPLEDTLIVVECLTWLVLFVVQVFIAQSRSSGRHRDVEDEELTRIFVMIPKHFSEEDLKDTFKVAAHALQHVDSPLLQLTSVHVLF